jgi:hypothetical protein
MYASRELNKGIIGNNLRRRSRDRGVGPIQSKGTETRTERQQLSWTQE